MEEDKKYFSEEELVEKVQAGEFTMVDYVERSNSDREKQYHDWCRENHQERNEESAMAFLELEEQRFEEFSRLENEGKLDELLAGQLDGQL